MEVKGKRVLVVGLGKSGVASALFLASRGARETAIRDRARDPLREPPPLNAVYLRAMQHQRRLADVRQLARVTGESLRRRAPSRVVEPLHVVGQMDAARKLALAFAAGVR